MNKPKFSKQFVMSVTFQHMMRAIDISLNKTVARIPDLEGREAAEVLETLSELSQVKEALEQYKAKRPDSFQKES